MRNLRSWLYTRCRWLAADRARRAEPPATVDPDTLPAPEPDRPLPDYPIDLIDHLTPRRATIVRMRLAGKEYDTITSELGITYGTARQLMKLAVADLRRMAHARTVAFYDDVDRL